MRAGSSESEARVSEPGNNSWHSPITSNNATRFIARALPSCFLIRFEARRISTVLTATWGHCLWVPPRKVRRNRLAQTFGSARLALTPEKSTPEAVRQPIRPDFFTASCARQPRSVEGKKGTYKACPYNAAKKLLTGLQPFGIFIPLMHNYECRVWEGPVGVGDSR